jgi:hypothetical protein
MASGCAREARRAGSPGAACAKPRARCGASESGWPLACASRARVLPNEREARSATFVSKHAPRNVRCDEHPVVAQLVEPLRRLVWRIVAPVSRRHGSGLSKNAGWRRRTISRCSRVRAAPAPSAARDVERAVASPSTMTIRRGAFAVFSVSGATRASPGTRSTRSNSRPISEVLRSIRLDPVVQRLSTAPFHGANAGSNPARVATPFPSEKGAFLLGVATPFPSRPSHSFRNRWLENK